MCYRNSAGRSGRTISAWRCNATAALVGSSSGISAGTCHVRREIRERQSRKRHCLHPPYVPSPAASTLPRVRQHDGCRQFRLRPKNSTAMGRSPPNSTRALPISVGLVAAATIGVFFGAGFLLLVHPRKEIVANTGTRDPPRPYGDTARADLEDRPAPRKSAGLDSAAITAKSDWLNRSHRFPLLHLLPLAGEFVAFGLPGAFPVPFSRLLRHLLLP